MTPQRSCRMNHPSSVFSSKLIASWDYWLNMFLANRIIVLRNVQANTTPWFVSRMSDCVWLKKNNPNLFYTGKFSQVSSDLARSHSATFISCEVNCFSMAFRISSHNAVQLPKDSPATGWLRAQTALEYTRQLTHERSPPNGLNGSNFWGTVEVPCRDVVGTKQKFETSVCANQTGFVYCVGRCW